MITFDQVVSILEEKSSIDNIEEQQKQVKELNLPSQLTNLISGYCALVNQEIIFNVNNTKHKEICLNWIKDIL